MDSESFSEAGAHWWVRGRDDSGDSGRCSSGGELGSRKAACNA